MSNRRYGAVLAAIFGPALATLAIACGTTWDDYYLPLTDPKLATDAGTDGDGGDPDCEGDPTKDPALVRDGCGVFVSASAAPGGDGRKAKPFRTFAEAAAATPARVFACAETYSETMQVSFSDGVEVYGGFGNCTSEKGWTWQASAFATLNGASDVPALVLDGGANRIENLNIIAADAVMAGASSIAVLVNGGALDMLNGTLEAKAAKAGDPGTHPADDIALDGEQGDPGVGICDSGASNPGPKGKTKVCSTGDGSNAGNGGDGGDFTAGNPNPAGSGTDGTPTDISQPTKGKGGIGEGQGTPATATCDDGTTGAPGASGNSGVGAMGAGALSASGYAGNKGADGTNGKPGQGGGGGGGAKGAKSITCNAVTQDRVGASGGGGGTGGCGGALGGGGYPGGSSIALVSLNATISLGQTTLKSSLAGDGGKGGDGQSGGTKGFGGTPGSGGSANDSCRGGDGGKGGNGGPGGGGQGGHSLGVAFKGKAPTGGVFQIDPANFGKGGGGGNGNTTTDNGKGADGVTANTRSFD
ncbi:Endoglucanase [Minicystis rosea]|nr:Endoglucanase [Minicystis rosea]